MIIQDYDGIGYKYLMTIKGGHLIEAINQAYKTPYQLKYNGLAVKLAKSSSYDADAVPTVGVVVPCGAGEKPRGWVFITSAAHNPLPGAPQTFLPADVYLTATDGNSIYYTDDMSEFAVVTIAPYQPGEGIGVPLAAGENVTIGDALSVATGGFYRVAQSTDVVVGIAETMANNSAGVNGAKFVWMTADHQYTSS